MKNRKYHYICQNCGFVKEKTSNIKTKTWWCFKLVGKSFFFAMFLFGFLAFINFIHVGIYSNPDNLISIGGSYAAINNLFGSYRYKDEINQIEPFAINLTKGCNNNECKAKKIYDHLLTFSYKDENATDLNPLKTWKMKEGDCDQMSFLIVSMLQNIKIKSNLLCSATHCFVIIELKDKTIKADIVNDIWKEI